MQRGALSTLNHLTRSRGVKSSLRPFSELQINQIKVSIRLVISSHAQFGQHDIGAILPVIAPAQVSAYKLLCYVRNPGRRHRYRPHTIGTDVGHQFEAADRSGPCATSRTAPSW
jgi:hypothetical protein